MQNNNHNEEIELETEDGVSDAEKKIKKLKKELEICHKEKDEYLSGWQRAKADYINFKKDEEKARESLIRFAEEGLMKDMMEVIDGLERAREHGFGKPDNGWDEGMNNVYKEFIKVLTEHGVKEIENFEEFNPEIHEAIEQVAAENEKEDNKIIKILQKGYEMNGKILRPAKVRVGIYKKE